MDRHSQHFAKVRAAFTVVVAPIQYMVDWPVHMADWLVTSVSTHQRLLSENAHLRAEQLLLKAKLQKFLSLQKENSQLLALLQSSTKTNGEVTMARVLSVDSDPFVHQVLINKGSNDKVFLGQPVLDAYGVMGQIVDVGPITSRVLLLTDRRSAIPVKIYRTDLRGIAAGTGMAQDLSLVNIPETVDVKVGDVLVSSGLGQRYPSGYPVGKVVQLTHPKGEHFAHIVLAPSAHINRSQQVMLVWPSDITNKG